MAVRARRAAAGGSLLHARGRGRRYGGNGTALALRGAQGAAAAARRIPRRGTARGGRDLWPPAAVLRGGGGRAEGPVQLVRDPDAASRHEGVPRGARPK